MKTIQKIDSIQPQIRRRKRVAAYARVSKETDRLNHSLSAQVSYYSTLIQNNPEWQYAGVYTDFGISGTTMDKRASLKNLLADCEQGKIDIILTKSISRFARNTVDLLKTVRHLKEINVEVRFEKEKIHSLSGDGELMLSILASFAQEESRSISENIKWSLRKKRENGTGGIRYGRVFGYAYDGYNYQIVPTEAKIVKEIYRQYLSGLAMNKIVEQLDSKRLTTVAANSFSICQIKAILTNELYIGDRKLQKFYVFDPISKHKRRNHGELDQYYMTDCHDPIIKRELFEKVQIELVRRQVLINPRYCFSSKIKCQICGKNFSRRSHKKNSHKATLWQCTSRKKSKLGCEKIELDEVELKKICAEILALPIFDETTFSEEIKSIQVLDDEHLSFEFYGRDKKLWPIR